MIYSLFKLLLEESEARRLWLERPRDMKETVKLLCIVEQQKLEDKTTTTMTRKQNKKVKKNEIRERFVYIVGCQRGL